MLGRCIYREENEKSHLEIWDQGDCRSLWFDDVILQSEIHLHDPAVLPNPVNRTMLAHLMFGLPLQRVLLAGCGGKDGGAGHRAADGSADRDVPTSVHRSDRRPG